MSVYANLVNLLFIFSTALLYPVIIALLLLFGWSLALIGSLISEYTSRQRDISQLEEACLQVGDLAASGRYEQIEALLGEHRSRVQVTAALGDVARAVTCGAFHHRFEKILQDSELRMGKAIEPVRIGTRIGPMLGLMGTLIPMGPALISLSRGDIKQMADSLVIAFSTTVIGLAVGGICYGTYVIRNRWYRQDLSDLEYILLLLRSKVGGDESD